MKQVGQGRQDEKGEFNTGSWRLESARLKSWELRASIPGSVDTLVITWEVNFQKCKTIKILKPERWTFLEMQNYQRLWKGIHLVNWLHRKRCWKEKGGWKNWLLSGCSTQRVGLGEPSSCSWGGKGSSPWPMVGQGEATGSRRDRQREGDRPALVRSEHATLRQKVSGWGWSRKCTWDTLTLSSWLKSCWGWSRFSVSGVCWVMRGPPTGASCAPTWACTWGGGGADTTLYWGGAVDPGWRDDG